MINLINVKYKQNKIFEKISNKSNIYIKKSFENCLRNFRIKKLLIN